MFPAMHQSVTSHQVHMTPLVNMSSLAFSPCILILAVECKCKQTDIPQDVILGHLRPTQDGDLQLYEDAAENTAIILSESWMCWANGQAALTPTAAPHPTATSISSSQTYKISEQQRIGSSGT